MPTTHKKVILMKSIGGVVTPLSPHSTSDNISVGESTLDEKLTTINDNIDCLAETNNYLSCNMLPIGTIILWMGQSYPDGWLALDGSDISRTEYAELFALYGETYGSGDGSTTFTLPNQNANNSLNLQLPDYNYIVKANNILSASQPDTSRDDILKRLEALEKMVGLNN